MSDSNQTQFIQEYQYADSSEGLLFYDTAIAFSQEYQVVWSRGVTGASAIYIALRYSNLTTAVMTLALLAVPSCAVVYLKVGVYGRFMLCVPFTISIWLPRSRQWIQYCLAEARRSLLPRIEKMIQQCERNEFTYVLAIDISALRISSVVLCRFFLNLRQAANSHDATDVHSSRTFSGTTSRIVGDMGEMLQECPCEESTPVDEYYDIEVENLDARTIPDGDDEVDGSAAVAEGHVV
ncbi:predicted protein [Postia placenta Mad-698-R]|uniref:DUF6533 domain-containing protein n=1 Tax=Postia placenta MAD-698-R-SB12 TaxID=670580 RepID=A0A1X6MZ61_9APHY|nr:hypothetical protein POSPLADRAFT_1144553 [Postia placenta MAD-698-R-SB12]EED83429.1 predicted protein [Postia placenta Mad-698-R]OSX61506.1 hypothetical protein POSPLADRAFT_1144553 [Postia placenta MAD-698-R-SB12]